MKLGLRLLFFGILLSLAACSGGPQGQGGGAGVCDEASTEIVSLAIYPARVAVVPNETFQFATKALNKCGHQVTGATLSWLSSNDAVASMGGTGRIRGLLAGTAAVSATLVAGPTGTKTGAAPSQATTGVTATATLYVLGASPADTTVTRVDVFPEDPVVALGNQLQMTAVAYNLDGERIPGVSFTWRSDRPDIAVIDTNTGLVSPVQMGVAPIVASPVGSSTVYGYQDVVVLDENGAPMPLPEISVSPSGLVMAVGDVRFLRAYLIDPLTGNPAQGEVSWTASPGGIVGLTWVGSGEEVRLDGVGVGVAEVVARAVVDGRTVESGPVLVDVLHQSGTSISDWTFAGDLPQLDGIFGHRMAALQGHLFTTGGVTGEFAWSGPREDVVRGKIQEPLAWDRSEVISANDPAERVLGVCGVDQFDCTPVDPQYMYIWREGSDLTPPRWVHYQVFNHAMATTDNHLVVVGGIDAQIDLCVTGGGIDQECQANAFTRASDRVLLGRVSADGSLTGWQEGPRLPSGGIQLPANMIDTPGRIGPAMVRYGEWLYVMGGWNWVYDEIAQTYIGRNRDEIFRARFDANGMTSGWEQTGLLIDSLNKHAAVVVGDWLVVSGGSIGTGTQGGETITDIVSVRKFNGDAGSPNWGRFDSGWSYSGRLPVPLAGHAMVSIPGDNRIVVVGGNNEVGGRSDVYMAEVNPLTGQVGEWLFLPPLPFSYGLTNFGAAAVPVTVDGASGMRVYIAGGGEPISGVDNEMRRSQEVWYIDIGG